MNAPKVDRRLLLAGFLLWLAVMYWLPIVVVEVVLTVSSLALAAFFVRSWGAA